MCQVLWGEVGLVDHGVDLCAEEIEGALERGGDGAQGRECGGQSGAQQAVVSSGEEQRDAQAEVGDAISEAIGYALD